MGIVYQIKDSAANLREDRERTESKIFFTGITGEKKAY